MSKIPNKFSNKVSQTSMKLVDGEEYQEKIENVTSVIHILETNYIIFWTLEN